ncbi:hypothetical protein BJ912DRAFT_919425 [Pholiota molesta]|nr:hypothetical protein BJ912DRAFT_919425 [Pholiota molesta]
MPKSERNEGKWTELEPILCTSGQEGGTRRWHQRVMRAPKIGNARARGGVDAGYTPGRDCGNSPAPRLPVHRVGQDLKVHIKSTLALARQLVHIGTHSSPHTPSDSVGPPTPNSRAHNPN